MDQALDEDLSLPDGLWDYLMMDDSETSSTILEDIILSSPSPSPTMAASTTTTTTTTTTTPAEESTRMKTAATSSGGKEEGVGKEDTKDLLFTTNPKKGTTEVLEEKLLALDTFPPVPVMSSHPPSFSVEIVEEKDKVIPELSVKDLEQANHDDLDAILAKQMEQLSMYERMKYNKEIHGISDDDECVKERPQFIQEKLDQMEVCLTTRIVSTRNLCKDAYERALYTSPEYVRDPKFRTLFLKGAQYDPYVAATTFVHHFQVKLELFGKDLLTKDIALADLNDEDIQALKQGAEQLLPVRDSHDRLVVCMLATEHKPLYGSRSRNRALFYFGMAMICSNENSNGIIMIVMNVGKNRVYYDEVSNLIKMRHVFRCFPARGSAFHYCYDDGRIYPNVAFAQFLLLSLVKGRFLAHYGDRSKYLYQLQTYGVPTQCIPLDEHGNVLVDNHLKWIEQRSIGEEKARYVIGSAPSYILVPRRFDVLLGRGKTASEHTGNLRAFHIVEMNRERYEHAGKFEKTQIAEKIVHLINQSYGRFLKRDACGVWVETTMDEARAKISHCFRRLRELDSKSNSAAKRKPAKPVPVTTEHTGKTSFARKGTLCAARVGCVGGDSKRSKAGPF